MRIAFVAQPLDELPSRTGSSLAIWVDELARRFGASEHDVRVFCAVSSQSRDSDLQAYDIERVSTFFDEKIETGVGILERRMGWLDQANREFYHRNYYYSWPYYFRYANGAARSIRAFQPDWIVLVNFSQFVPIFRFWNRKAKIFLMMQCDWLVELPYAKTRRRLSFLDAVGGCSDYIANGVRERFPECASKCHTIYNASDTGRFNRSEFSAAAEAEMRDQYDLQGKDVVLFVGRMAPEKGVHVLLKAMAVVLQAHPNAMLLIAGNVSKQPPSPKWIFQSDSEFQEFANLNHGYSAMLDDLGSKLGDSVKFLGHVNHYELASLYSLADVFVHPAIWNEPFGMILTEAMACGTGVVSTNVGGIPEVVQDRITGLLVEPGDSDALAGAIVKLLGDEELRQEMSLQGQALVQERFTWENTARLLLEVFEVEG